MTKNKLIIFSLMGLIIVWGLIVLLTKTLSGLDVIGQDAVKSFKEVLNVLPPQTQIKDEWYIIAPDETAEFHWTGSIIQMKALLTPFIKAGLVVSKLNNADDKWLYFAEDFAMLPKFKATALKQFEYIVSIGRANLGYHLEMDHYNLTLDEGNLFEWAKDLTTNDKDIVFVLNPEPLINAGVNPLKVEGWIYDKVSMMKNGKKIEAYKFLKVFNLK